MTASTKNPVVITNNKLYDTLKYFAMVVLPAIGTLYFALAQIWGLPHGGEVVGSITALDTFLGVQLHLSSSIYNNTDAKYDGTVDVTDTGDKKNFLLNVNSDLDTLDQKKELRLKINSPSVTKVRKARKKAATSSE